MAEWVFAGLSGAFVFGEGGDDEGVGVGDEVAEKRGRQGAVDEDGVPVALVHVVAGADGFVAVAEGDGAGGVAFEVHSGRIVGGIGEGEDFAADFVDEDLGAEGGGFFGTGEGEAEVDGFRKVHWGKSARSATAPCLFLSEDLGEEGFHGFPGAGVGLGVVGGAFGGVVSGHFLGEGVDGSGVGVELPVGAGVVHFLFECGDLLGGDVGVDGAVEDEDFGGDFAFFGGKAGRGVERAVEADDSGDVGTGAGELEDGGAAEAVADGGDFGGLGEFVGFEKLEGGVEAGAKEGAVGFVFSGFFGGFGGDGADAFAVDVGGEDVVAEFGELAGAAFFVVGEAGPLVDDEDGGAFAGGGVVVNAEAFEGDAALFVFDGFLDEGGAGGGEGEEGEKRKEEAFHHGYESRE